MKFVDESLCIFLIACKIISINLMFCCIQGDKFAGYAFYFLRLDCVMSCCAGIPRSPVSGGKTCPQDLRDLVSSG